MFMSMQLGWTFCRQMCSQARFAGVSPQRAQGTKLRSQDEENKTSPDQAAELEVTCTDQHSSWKEPAHAPETTAHETQPILYQFPSEQLRLLLPSFGHDTPKLLKNLSHNTCCWEKRSVFKSHHVQWRIPSVTHPGQLHFTGSSGEKSPETSCSF